MQALSRLKTQLNQKVQSTVQQTQNLLAKKENPDQEAKTSDQASQLSSQD